MSKYHNQLIEFKNIITETEKAYLINLDNERSFWIPKSLIQSGSSRAMIVWDRFEPKYLPIVSEEKVEDMFSIIEEPNKGNLIKANELMYPTPFD